VKKEIRPREGCIEEESIVPRTAILRKRGIEGKNPNRFFEKKTGRKKE